MRIPPVPDLLVQPQIFVADVDAARKAGFAVDHDDFAVVAVVDASAAQRRAMRKKTPHLHAALRQPADIGPLQLPAPEAVVDEPHLHAFPRLADQGIPEPSADAVVAQDVVGEMDVVPGLVDHVEDRPERRFPVRQNLGPVAAGDRRIRHAQQRPPEPVVRDGGAARRGCRNRRRPRRLFGSR